MIPEIITNQSNLIINSVWMLFAIFVVIFFRRAIKEDLLPRTRSIEIAGVKMTFFEAGWIRR